MILIIIVYFLFDGMTSNFWVVTANFFSFLASMLISLKTYKCVAVLLKNNFSMPFSISNAIGFLITASLAEIMISSLIMYLIRKFPSKLQRLPYQKILNVIPALGEALVLIAFILTLILALPTHPKIKAAISESKIGGYIVTKTGGVEKDLNEIFGGIVEEGINYLTIRPGSSERIPLNIEKRDLAVDKETEMAMFALVNEERSKAGSRQLTIFTGAVPVAENYAEDMWERQYFSHYSPEGDDVGDRLEKAGIDYHTVGENLALAPTLSIAHKGLMNSEGHRRNILDPQFKKVAIGIVDNGVYGKMFVQIFSD
ncbi:hypothetical protein A3E41_05035 [Candidatus Woesebacteria bacterium RIFCSPHIGHO2_12_FULL_38_9]|nr:MAG: hypothetical protein A3E41_05035 [Candidatus Woesebacteria bacterium RIFCSPHIGHO2_12_FULL_38_9]